MNDTVVPRNDESLPIVIEDGKKSVEAMTKWLKYSDLKVNKSRTELCIFYKKHVAHATIMLDNTQIV